MPFPGCASWLVELVMGDLFHMDPSTGAKVY